MEPSTLVSLGVAGGGALALGLSLQRGAARSWDEAEPKAARAAKVLKERFERQLSEFKQALSGQLIGSAANDPAIVRRTADLYDTQALQARLRRDQDKMRTTQRNFGTWILAGSLIVPIGGYVLLEPAVSLGVSTTAANVAKALTYFLVAFWVLQLVTSYRAQDEAEQAFQELYSRIVRAEDAIITGEANSLTPDDEEEPITIALK